MHAGRLAGLACGAVILSGGDPSFNLREGAKQFAFYAQDDWKDHATAYTQSRTALRRGLWFR